MFTALPDLTAAAARGLLESQQLLDDAGRDGFDAFDDSGVPPTVFTWSTCALSLPVRMSLAPRAYADGRTQLVLTPTGTSGHLGVRLRYLLSPQGGDDPKPHVAGEGRPAVPVQPLPSAESAADASGDNR